MSDSSDSEPLDDSGDEEIVALFASKRQADESISLHVTTDAPLAKTFTLDIPIDADVWPAPTTPPRGDDEGESCGIAGLGARCKTAVDYDDPEKPLKIHNRLTDTRKRVETLTEKVRQNLQAIMQRGDRFDDLNERAHFLVEESHKFKQTTRTLKKKMWLQNQKMMIGIGIVLLVFILLVVHMNLPLDKRLF